MHNLVAPAKKDTYIRDLLEGRMLQRVDDEKNRGVSGATGHAPRVGYRDEEPDRAGRYGRRRVGAMVVIFNVPAFLVVGTLDIVTAANRGLFSRNPVKIVRKSWA